MGRKVTRLGYLRFLEAGVQAFREKVGPAGRSLPNRLLIHLRDIFLILLFPLIPPKTTRRMADCYIDGQHGERRGESQQLLA